MKVMSLCKDPQWHATVSDSVEPEAQLVTSGECDWLAIQGHTPEEAQKLLSKHGAKGAVVVSEGANAANIEWALRANGPKHLIGANSPNAKEELRALWKALIQGPGRGAAAHLGEGTHVIREELFNSRDISSCIDRALSQVDFSSYFESPLDYLRTTANELITNAFYNAPGDATKDRRESVRLPEGKGVVLEVGVAPKAVAVAVSDRYGALTWERALRSISRAQKEKTALERAGGAGLGLGMAFAYSNRFIISERPGERTEVVSVIECHRRHSAYKGRITSFHYFQEERA